jgi:hypothetical protein
MSKWGKRSVQAAANSARSDALDRTVNIWDHDRRIVGIVEDIRDRPADIAAEPPSWMPLAREPFGRVQAAIRTSGDPLGYRVWITSIDRGNFDEPSSISVSARSDAT